MTKKEFIQTIRETQRLLISLTNATKDMDLAVMETLRSLETIVLEAENSTDKLKVPSGEWDCMTFDKEEE